MAELETGLPSFRQIQSLIRDKKQVELKLITQESLVGNIHWQDTQCVCLMDENEQQTIVWRGAIAYLKAKG
ncbi:RNA-binding protein hfq [Microcoleus sp. FACHB-831]|uniref:Hfq-related RNA-binding protein n=1 Tax=Microcoleus sp. FACHB-831 TaxID=2692827 RepID=UPI001687265B|nr:RNA-binding protein hfq [Microcoleus sp. FACHB-831]MBD1924053.1 RNA-binding protein hfq [Microcoleus sp. FACHB-831]